MYIFNISIHTISCSVNLRDPNGLWILLSTATDAAVRRRLEMSAQSGVSTSHSCFPELVAWQAPGGCRQEVKYWLWAKTNSFLGSNSFSLELEKVVGLEVVCVVVCEPYRPTSLWLLLHLYWKKKNQLGIFCSFLPQMNVGESLLPVILTCSQWGLMGMGEGSHDFKEFWGTSAPSSPAASTMGKDFTGTGWALQWEETSWRVGSQRSRALIALRKLTLTLNYFYYFTFSPVDYMNATASSEIAYFKNIGGKPHKFFF